MLKLRAKVLIECPCLVVSNLEVSSAILAKQVAEGIRILASLASKILK